MKTQTKTIYKKEIANVIAKNMCLEGTEKSPRKFSIGEINSRVREAFLIAPNEELENVCIELITDVLRSKGRIKKEQSNYTLPQTILSYRVLNPKTNDNVIASLFTSGKFEINLDEEELKEFRLHIEKPTKNNNFRWKIITKKLDDDGNLVDKDVTFSPNYS